MDLFFSLSGLFNAVASTLLGLLVFFKNRKNIVNQTFALFCLAVAAWSYPYTFWPLAQTKEATLFWFQLLHIGANFAPITYLHFVVSWLGLIKTRKIKITIFVGYLLATFFACLVFSPYFIKDMIPKFSMRFWAVPGLLYHFYLVFFFGYAIYSSYLLIKNYGEVSGVKKSQMKYIFAGMVLSFAGGSTNYPLWYNINFPPYGNILASSYVILSAYAIVVHRLMDIKLVLRRSSVYIFSLTTVLIIAFGLRYLFGYFLSVTSGWVDLAILILTLYFFPPIKDYYYRQANKYFFSSLYDSGQVISKLSDKLRSTLDINRVYGLISQSLIDALHIKNFGVLGHEKAKDEYFILYNNGFETAGRNRFPGNRTLQKEFVDKSRSIVVEELKGVSFLRTSRKPMIY